MPACHAQAQGRSFGWKRRVASLYDLKPAFQQCLRPGVRLLAKAGVTPNQVTATALLLSCVVGGLVMVFPAQRWPLLLVPVGLFLRMALNAIDGVLAREHGMQSQLGGILNEVGDVWSDAAIYLPFALVPGVPPHLLVPTVVLAAISEMAGVVPVQIGTRRRYDGPMGKSDRAFVFGALALLLGLGVPAGSWVVVLLLVTAGLLLITIANRIRAGLREVS
jgi:CDP-diacylglycerol--glycerol-3-phosphate 3-phosphatidyltransferase